MGQSHSHNSPQSTEDNNARRAAGVLRHSRIHVG